MVLTDNDIKIKISDELLHTIKGYCQTNWSDYEAGGVLAGRENISNGNIIIEYLSTPQTGDYCSRARFIRKDTEHVLFFQKLYQNNGETIRYIGEWHTHPEDVPHYSKIDLDNWKRISKECFDSRIHYHLIAGRVAFSIWKIEKGKRKSVQLIEKKWEDLE